MGKDTGSEPTSAENATTTFHRDSPNSLYSFLTDFYVDILGSLFPGLFTVILGFSLFSWTFYSVYTLSFLQSPASESTSSNMANQPQGNPSGVNPQAITSGSPQSDTTDQRQRTPSAASNTKSEGFTGVIGQFHGEIMVLVIVSAFIAGAAFHRQDPKIPDKVSALRVWLTVKEPLDQKALAAQAREVEGSSVSPNMLDRLLNRIFGWVMSAYFPERYLRLNNLTLDTQFPYLYMGCYLKARGLDHLLDFISWCPEKPKTKGNRTKMLINILKIHIGMLGSQFERDILRNEAHIRLATSVWFSCKLLSMASILCLLVLAVTGVPIMFKSSWPHALEILYGPVVLSVLIVGICQTMRFYLRKCIHYMRVREVVYVLETAHVARKVDNRFRESISNVTGCEVCHGQCSRQLKAKDQSCQVHG